MSDRQLADETRSAERDLPGGAASASGVGRGAAPARARLRWRSWASPGSSAGASRGARWRRSPRPRCCPRPSPTRLDAVSAFRHAVLPPEGTPARAAHADRAPAGPAGHPLAGPWVKLGDALDVYSLWAAVLMAYGVAAVGQVPRQDGARRHPRRVGVLPAPHPGRAARLDEDIMTKGRWILALIILLAVGFATARGLRPHPPPPVGRERRDGQAAGPHPHRQRGRARAGARDGQGQLQRHGRPALALRARRASTSSAGQLLGQIDKRLYDRRSPSSAARWPRRSRRRPRPRPTSRRTRRTSALAEAARQRGPRQQVRPGEDGDPAPRSTWPARDVAEAARGAEPGPARERALQPLARHAQRAHRRHRSSSSTTRSASASAAPTSARTW